MLLVTQYAHVLETVRHCYSMRRQIVTRTPELLGARRGGARDALVRSNSLDPARSERGVPELPVPPGSGLCSTGFTSTRLVGPPLQASFISKHAHATQFRTEFPGAQAQDSVDGGVGGLDD